jgi:hypothetical protein
MTRFGVLRQAVLLLHVWCALSVWAAASERNLITTNLAGLAIGIYSINYEFGVADTMSLSVGFFGGGIKDATQWEKFAVNGGAGITWCFYTGDRLLRGFYIGPTMAFASLDLDHVESPPVKGEVVIIGANLGYRWVLGSGIAVGVEAGAGYLAGRVFNESTEVPFGDIVPTNGALQMGFAF